VPNGSSVSCDDGDLCTQNDRCNGSGTCIGDPVVCQPLDGCHLPGVCDGATGTCSNPVAPNGTACDDGNPCTLTDTCFNGACIGGNPVDCTAPDQCHENGICDPVSGECSNAEKPDGTACDDSNPCTDPDACQAGVCTGAPLPDGTTCGEVVICLSGLCVSGCYIDGAFHNADAENQANPCQRCDPTVSTSAWSPAPAGTGCDDGDACTENDQCDENGACGGDPMPDGSACADQFVCFQTECHHGCVIDGQYHDAGIRRPGNQCELCQPSESLTAWSPEPPDIACDDGNPCTVNDHCDGAGTCAAGTLVSCPVNQTCNPATGQCEQAACVPDGDPCPTPDGTNSIGCCPNAQGITSCCCNGLEETGICDGTGYHCCPASDVCSAMGSSCLDGGECCSGACVGGFCGCSNDGECEDDNPCAIDTCVDGTCNHEPITERIECPGGVCAGGECCPPGQACGGVCHPACDNGGDRLIANDCACPECVDHAECDDDHPCTTDFCSDGICRHAWDPVGCCTNDEECDRNWSGFICCGGQCKDPTVDDFHCGGCNRVCPAGQNCSVNGCCWPLGFGATACNGPSFCCNGAAICHDTAGCCLEAGACGRDSDCCSGSCGGDGMCA
jgi:hypothetical protein